MTTTKMFLGMNFPIEVVRDKNIRLKLTSRCQWSCHFCHMEGQAGSPPLQWSESAGNQILKLMNSMGRTKVHLTGGEPTVYPKIVEVVSFFKKNGMDIAITTNGQFEESLRRELVACGCSSFSFSLPTLDVREFITFHKRDFTVAKAEENINRSIRNILAVKASGMKADINLVFSERITSMASLFELAFDKGINVSLLGVLDDLSGSEARIKEMLALYRLEPVEYKSYGGTSRARYIFRNKKSGTLVSLKLLEPVFLSSMCDACPMRSKCEEKFYGIRVEQNRDRLMVRTCVHKNILTPADNFPNSHIGLEVREVCK